MLLGAFIPICSMFSSLHMGLCVLSCHAVGVVVSSVCDTQVCIVGLHLLPGRTNNTLSAALGHGRVLYGYFHAFPLTVLACCISRRYQLK